MTQLIIGDIHSNFQNNKERIEKKIDKYNPDKIVFLGDYVDKRDQCSIDQEELCFVVEDLDAFGNWVDDLGIDTVCLCGNHDWGYLSDRTMPTGQTFERDIYGFDEINRLLLKLDLKLAEIVGNMNEKSLYVCSHAGFCNKWLELNGFDNLNGDEGPFSLFSDVEIDDMRTGVQSTIHYECIDLSNFVWQVNEMFDYVLENREIAHPNPIEFCGKMRGGWDMCSGPLWCDIQELMFNAPNCVNQIVGHSHTKAPFDVFCQNWCKPQVWMIDTSKSGKCGIVAINKRGEVRND